MLIDTAALVKHATVVAAQGQEFKALLENHRAELQKAKEHFIKIHRAAIDKMTADHRSLVDGLTTLQNELDEAIAKIAGEEYQKPMPTEKETTDVTQEG